LFRGAFTSYKIVYIRKSMAITRPNVASDLTDDPLQHFHHMSVFDKVEAFHGRFMQPS
jgi:hypothetical protein